MASSANGKSFLRNRLLIFQKSNLSKSFNDLPQTVADDPKNITADCKHPHLRKGRSVKLEPIDPQKFTDYEAYSEKKRTRSGTLSG